MGHPNYFVTKYPFCLPFQKLFAFYSMQLHFSAKPEGAMLPVSMRLEEGSPSHFVII